jgi:hypothetical protein
MLPTRVTAGERAACPASWAASRAATLAKEDRRAGKTSGEPVRILIVEDDFLAAIDMEAVLTEAGYQVPGLPTERMKRCDSPSWNPPLWPSWIFV